MRLGQTADEHGKRRGAFIKTLVDDHPLLAPMADIEPDFTPLISVCMELPPPRDTSTTFGSRHGAGWRWAKRSWCLIRRRDGR